MTFIRNFWNKHWFGILLAINFVVYFWAGAK